MSFVVIELDIQIKNFPLQFADAHFMMLAHQAELRKELKRDFLKALTERDVDRADELYESFRNSVVALVENNPMVWKNGVQVNPAKYYFEHHFPHSVFKQLRAA